MPQSSREHGFGHSSGFIQQHGQRELLRQLEALALALRGLPTQAPAVARTGFIARDRIAQDKDTLELEISATQAHARAQMADGDDEDDNDEEDDDDVEKDKAREHAAIARLREEQKHAERTIQQKELMETEGRRTSAFAPVLMSGCMGSQKPT